MSDGKKRGDGRGQISQGKGWGGKERVVQAREWRLNDILPPGAWDEVARLAHKHIEFNENIKSVNVLIDYIYKNSKKA